MEISKRQGLSGFELKSYLGVTALVMKPEDVIAGKLLALLTRRKFAMRDVFDMWFFLKNNWSINETVVTENTDLSLSKALEVAAKKVSKIDKSQVLHGLEDLLDEKQKVWVKESLIDETVFYLRDYRYRHLPVSENIPVLDIDPGVGGTGGPQGRFVHFHTINIGEKVAIDVRWGIRGFAYEWRSPDLFVMRPGDKKKLEYKISDERPFREFVPELNIFFEYQDNRGVGYFTRRELALEKVPSGEFYNITKVGTFHPAVVLEDSKIRNISDPYTPQGDFTTEVVVDVEVDGGIKQVKIGMAPGLAGFFGFPPQ